MKIYGQYILYNLVHERMLTSGFTWRDPSLIEGKKPNLARHVVTCTQLNVPRGSRSGASRLLTGMVSSCLFVFLPHCLLSFLFLSFLFLFCVLVFSSSHLVLLSFVVLSCCLLSLVGWQGYMKHILFSSISPHLVKAENLCKAFHEIPAS